MSNNFTPAPTTVNGYLQSPAPVNRCIETTAGKYLSQPGKEIYDAKQRYASFFWFRKSTGKRKIISKYKLPVEGLLPATNCQLSPLNPIAIGCHLKTSPPSFI